MRINVKNETAPLEAVVLGIGVDKGVPLKINPLVIKHLKEGTYPSESDIVKEISTLEEVLLANEIEVYRPHNMPGVNQIFTRDIGFVIDDVFVVSNMATTERSGEIKGIKHVTSQICKDKIIVVPDGAFIEGGDVILWNDYIFVGKSKRTNAAGIEFLDSKFPHKKVIALDLVNSNNADENILHLDCTFQPIGKDEAIIYEEGFASPPVAIYRLFPEEKLIRVNKEEKKRMFPNVFSIAPYKVIIEKGFVNLKNELEKRGYQTFEVDYSETSKLCGLLRCSTLPLRRKDN